MSSMHESTMSEPIAPEAGIDPSINMKTPEKILVYVITCIEPNKFGLGKPGWCPYMMTAKWIDKSA